MKEYTTNLINLRGYEVRQNYSDNYRLIFEVRVKAKYSNCPVCKKPSKTVYESKVRKVRHCFWFDRRCNLLLKQRRFKCHNCKRRFWEVAPGLIKYARRTEMFKKQIAKAALKGHDNKQTAKDHSVGEATVQRDINHHSRLEVLKKSSNICPKVMGIDEHHFTKRKGFATTICDLARRKVFDVTLGRSEKALNGYLNALRAKERCKVVVMDLSGSYKAIVQKHFPKALIVADRFHVIKLLNLRFMEVWKQLDSTGRQNLALVSVFRRKPSNLSPEQSVKLQRYLRSKPGLLAMYDFRNELHELLMQRGLSKNSTRQEIKRYLSMLEGLENSGFKPLESLAATFRSWEIEILRMLRFSKSNGITEGFHNKMEVISRTAYGFRNFKNYRLRVLLKCA